MAALFPSFVKISQKVKEVLCTDVASIWQILQSEVDESNSKAFTADYLYW